MNKIKSDREAAASSFHQMSNLCGRCYQIVVEHLSVWKSKIESEFARTMKGYEQLLKASLNEAEALAWQTPYPHLLFPALAEEKAVEAQRWVLRQSRIRQQTQIASV